MARARNIKPGFFSNDALAECDVYARLLFPGLWTIADREGRLENRPKKIKAEILPYDTCDIVDLLLQLESKGFIHKYNVEGKDYIQIMNWHKHQTPHHMEAPSEIPSPEGFENKYTHSPITKAQRERIFARDKRKCLICGSREDLHIDHIIPVSKGGGSEDDNLRVLCQTCNLKKGNRVNDLISTVGEQVDNKSISNRHQVEHAPLIPDSLPLIPDSLSITHSNADSPARTEKPPKEKIKLEDLAFEHIEPWIATQATRASPITIDVRAELERFKTHFLAYSGKDKNGNAVSDWVAKFGSWILNEQKQQKHGAKNAAHHINNRPGEIQASSHDRPGNLSGSLSGKPTWKSEGERIAAAFLSGEKQ